MRHRMQEAATSEALAQYLAEVLVCLLVVLAQQLAQDLLEQLPAIRLRRQGCQSCRRLSVVTLSTARLHRVRRKCRRAGEQGLLLPNGKEDTCTFLAGRSSQVCSAAA